MLREDVEPTLIRLLRYEPFQPFVIDLSDGRSLNVRGRHLAINGGGATLWASDHVLEEFWFDDVRDIRPSPVGDASMTAETFDLTLRKLLRQVPFQPFVIELVDGRCLEVDRRRLAVNYGGATLVLPGFDLIDIVPNEVRDIRLATQEAGK